MASRRKTYTKPGPERGRGRGNTDDATFAFFMADLLSGAVKATAANVVRDGRGRLSRIEYDDPNG